ncbi:NUDIX domain-containing protein [Thermopolyspora flexuosa]|jgi:8-oxo-dGTP pyrophosphatase MutT (NUDIX family)|uniref:ADP-ribose pyrophosphatase YjhB (NUDIX family) n=1 Tax=Thermopolyspora flexuosa TaxID=103836 RepID=A0A543IU22_9ACTN|nr:NUDIX hydrolase [Thermopolyspora flexuosa]TQM74073.1 ADP-ribose pyrophosphatase YjhB (NUDIX family) [Thermopolyspora flexuosa]
MTLDPAAWFASLPAHFASASVLFTDADDRVLLVKPNYRPGWSIPGGVMEAAEFPHQAAEREVFEELGLRVTPGELLVVHWQLPDGNRPRSLVTFVFDGGTLPPDAKVTLQEEELDEYGFFPWSQAAELLPEPVRPRLLAARDARKQGRAVYLYG